ncbi:FBD domain [Arabidopsis thaliana x Arabidopsis arenosa]|uniref:FBD domain n=1 Tax=Arabidopsis thaliana x Arabidopsis arenosa TaxID=1240361 RepID=A0A8T1ZND2_9BRAS|nr:FBD domain [Arabidopsis thaliana x Arabidopsis arenosa]
MFTATQEVNQGGLGLSFELWQMPNILLLVPTKDAVATTFLSKRWRFVWTMLPRLDYKEANDNSDVESKSVWWFLDESMRFHKAPFLERLLIQLGPQCPVDVDPVKWFAKAVASRVRWLSFNLLWKSKPIRMPKSIYVCKTLGRLTLANKILVDVPHQVSLPSLTELDLSCVVYKDEDSHASSRCGWETVQRETAQAQHLGNTTRHATYMGHIGMWPNLTQKLAQELRIATSFIYYPKILIPSNVGHSNRLLSSCPALKRLKVIRDKRIDDNVRKFSVKVPSLLKLEYSADKIFQEEDDDTDRSLVIDTPNLLSLDIDTLGHSCSVEYMPHLVIAEIDVEFYLNENILRSLSSVKYLVLFPFDTILFPWPKVVINYSRLVECTIYLSDQDMCESLAVFLSYFSKLRVFMVDTRVEIGQPANHDSAIWNQPSSVPKCLSSHLEIFEWDGYRGREYEKELIRYILENSKCLKTAGIAPNPTFSGEEKQKMMEELESMHRVSTSSVLLSSAQMLFGDVYDDQQL